MPVTQDRLTRLREFGLSEYAARSYLALLDLGIAEARDVSSISKVPQAKIYHVLEQLHEKGLVVILPEFPKKYAPVPFEEYLGRLYDEHTKAAAAIETERDLLAEMFRVVGDTDVGDRGFFTVIRGRRNVLTKIEEIIAGTSKDLLVLGTEGGAPRMAQSVGDLRRARERGVRTRIMAPIHAQNVEKLASLQEVADVRERDVGTSDQSGKVAIVIADGARAFLIHFVPDDDNVYSGKDIGVFTDQEAMVAAIQAIVEPHWARAATLAQRRAEIVEGKPAAAPAAQLAEKERILRTYERMTEAFYALDTDWRFVYRNPVTRAMQSQRADAEIDGQEIWKAFPDLVGTPFEREFRRAVAQQRPVKFEADYPRMGRWFEVSAYPGPEGLSVYFRDVTDRKEAERASRKIEERFRRAFLESPSAKAFAELDGRIGEANPAFAQLVGLSEKELAETRLLDLFAAADREPVRDAMKRLLDGAANGGVSCEATLAPRGGARVPARLTLSVLRDAAGAPAEILAHVQTER